ncbi:MAG: hypothetical protein HW390_1116 [Candidatus Brocadiaceae bacterium]|nr:hypothetical protein [Candidatus Brocadiaceae bacterium]
MVINLAKRASGKQWICLLWILNLLTLLHCTGCSTTSKSTLNVNLDDSFHQVKTVAVLRFDDKAIQQEGVQGFVVQSIPNPDAGEILAEIFTNELSRVCTYSILTRGEVKDRIRASGVKERTLTGQKDFAALQKTLKVDAIVFGKIDAFGIKNMPIYERGIAAFSAECIDIRNGNVVWSVEVNRGEPYKNEIEVAKEMTRKLMEQLKDDLKK